MKVVPQVDGTGCGIACIATLAGKSYEEVRSVALDKLTFPRAGEFYTKTSDLVILGKAFGVSVISKRRKPFAGYDALPDFAILSKRIGGTNKKWHWVVYVRTTNGEHILDPEEKLKGASRYQIDKYASEITHWLEVEI